MHTLSSQYEAEARESLASHSGKEEAVFSHLRTRVEQY